MDYLHRTHSALLRQGKPTLQRALMNEINWEDRIIGIRGSRGVGKTTFLLDYARRHYAPDSPECLYINLNQFSFTTIRLVDFVGDFIRQGGRRLLLDQVFTSIRAGWRSSRNATTAIPSYILSSLPQPS